MSQWVSLTVMPAEAFTRRQAGDAPTESARDGEQRFDLPSMWYWVHVAFSDEPAPLCHILEGDVRSGPSLTWSFGLAPEQQQVSAAADEGGGQEKGKAELPEPDGTYFAYVSPPTVASIAAALPRWPRWRVFEKLRKARPPLAWLNSKQGRDGMAEAYDQIVQVYTAAAKRGAALRMLVC